MSDARKKWRYILLPSLAVGLLYMAAYSVAHWVVQVQMGQFWPDFFIQDLLPVALAVIPVFIWLRPRFTLMQYANAEKESRAPYYIVAVGAIGISTAVAQNVLIPATHSLHRLPNVRALYEDRLTQYYAFDQYYLDAAGMGSYSGTYTSGKRNNTFNMEYYAAIPIRVHAGDTLSPVYAWLGFVRHESRSNSLPKQVLDQAYESFQQQSALAAAEANDWQITYFDRVGNNGNFDGIWEAMRRSPKFQGREAPFFYATSQPFSERYGNSLPIFVPLAIVLGYGILYLLVLAHEFDAEALREFELGLLSGKGWRNRKRFWQ